MGNSAAVPCIHDASVTSPAHAVAGWNITPALTDETRTHIHCDAAGTAWIDDTGVQVLQVAQEHVGHGWSADTIHENHPALTLAQIHAALAWYYDHQDEMDAAMNARAASARRLLASLGDDPAQRRFAQIKAAAAQ